MFKKPIVWLILILISLGCVIFTARYFSDAFPIVSLDVKMDRTMALKAAKDLAQKYNWGPENFQQAASFGVKNYVQNYVELEAGGTEAFREMIKGQLYSPYTWRVRHFKQGQTNETRIRFTPEGKPYGFWEKIPEEQPGAALDPNEALIIAQTSAAQDWQIDLTAYELIEKSQEVRPSERIDHKFVYERPDIKIGEGHYRLRLVVAGDKFTELTHFIKVPQAFGRRYSQMRSANRAIGLGAMVIAGLLYGVGGCGVGLFALLRKRWVLWRKPLLWGLFIAIMQVLAGINQLPLIWMFYDTAISTHGFLLTLLAQLLLGFVGMWLLFTISFMAAESLTRKAFPNHIRFWQLWSSDVACSTAVLGRTVSGYLLVSFFFAFIIAFYFITTKLLGWWMPSSSMFQPDMLATYFPWLTSIAISLQAGFWEECLFRAIPLAGAALLGQKFGRKWLWITGALIIQAVVFGACHAPYPNQPAYARLVELIIPSLGWGLIYLYFGLLPAIVLHFTVDVIAFSIPLFVSSTEGIWIDRTIVILLTLVPLWVVIFSRLRIGRWKILGQEHFNRSWQPATEPKPEPVVSEQTESAHQISSKIKCCVLVAGLVGLVLWYLATDFVSLAPRLTIPRKDVEKLAEKTLTDRGIELPDSWKLLATVKAPLNQDDRFVWQNGDKDSYKALIGTYLDTPYWRVRFAQFEGDVAERAEEYQLFISKENEVFRLIHKLPEAREGVTLTEQQARDIAYSVLTEKYQLGSAELEEISAVPYKRPNRKDWKFIFQDKINYPLQQGQARIIVEIAGDEVTDSYRYIHIPEQWQRQDRDKQNLKQIIQGFSGLIVIVMFLATAIVAIIHWSRGKFSVRAFRLCLLLLMGLGLINHINNWPNTIAGFSTAEPLSNQIFRAIASPACVALVGYACIALLAGFVQNWKNQLPQNPKTRSVWPGFALGTLIAGIGALTCVLSKPSLPYWPEYENYSAYIPTLAIVTKTISIYIPTVIASLIVFASLEHFTKGWTKRKLLFSALLILLALIVEAFNMDTIISWLLTGLFSGIVLILVYTFVLRCQLALVPLAIASLIILEQLQQGLFNPHPTALTGTVLSIILIGSLSIYWYRKLLRQE